MVILLSTNKLKEVRGMLTIKQMNKVKFYSTTKVRDLAGVDRD